MNIGQKVTIKGTNDIWEGKTGILEYLDDTMGTVLVDFKEDKKVRQDFDVDNIISEYEIEKKVEEALIEPVEESVTMIKEEVNNMTVDELRKKLADYLDVDEEDVYESSMSDGLDIILGVESMDAEYLVCDEDEARRKAKEEVNNAWDDMGLEAFTETFQEWILENAVDGDFFRDTQSEYYQSYVNDIEDEEDDEFENRLYAELYENDLLKDEDFEDEDHVGNSLKEEVYDKLEDLKAEYVDILVNNEDPLDFLKDIYSGKDFADIIMENNAIDIDKVAEEAVDEDGVAHFIAYYDGEEIDLGDGYFAYRIN